MADQHPEREEYQFLLERESFWQTFKSQLKDLFAPSKQPELVLESKPIPVKDIWAPPKPISSRLGSFGIHAAVVGVLMLPFWRPVRNQISKVVETQLFVPQQAPPQLPKMRRMAGGGAPVVQPQPKIIQATKVNPLTAPTSMVPLSVAMSAPSFGSIGPISGPPGPPGGGSGDGNGTADGTCVNDCGGGTVGTGPIATYQPDPEYSDAGRKAKFQGTCVVSIIIGTDGRVSHATVLQPLGLGLDEKAVEAVMKWRFIPAKDNNGRPMQVTAQVDVTFHLY